MANHLFFHLVLNVFSDIGSVSQIEKINPKRNHKKSVINNNNNNNNRIYNKILDRDWFSVRLFIT